jgi:bifunctional oligoribonuclease and PAP phosphatase NrnA
VTTLSEPNPTMPGPAATADEIVAVFNDPDRAFIVTSHRNPDGDAIGSMLGMYRALRAAGKDAVMAHVDARAIPDELQFLIAADEVVLDDLPADAAHRTLVAVDCASEWRLWDRLPYEGVAMVVNLDHHHDNTRFGHLNLIEPGASSSAEVVMHVIEAAGWPLTRAIAEPLYVGLVTDTGRFGYTNTGTEAHRVAGAMLEAGVDPSVINQRLYEEQPLCRLLLLARAVQTARVLASGRLMLAVLSTDDFTAAGGDDAEGIVEAMRAVEGVRVAGLARAAEKGLRVSLRASDETVDVSAIAREAGGGGHRSAAGFSTTLTPDELLTWVEERVVSQLTTLNA